MSRGKKRSRRNRRETKRQRTLKLVLVGVVAVVAVSMAGFAMAARPAAPHGTPATFAFEAPTVPPMVAIIGDSYTGGSDMGGHGKANWSALVGKDLGWITCDNAIGGSGWTVGAKGNTFGARVGWAVDQKPSLVIFFNGINDLNGGPGGIAKSATAALADLKAKAPGVPVVVIGPVLVRDLQTPGVRTMTDEVKAATLANGDIFINPLDEGWFGGDKRALLGKDNFHPTDEGHVYLAGLVEKAMTAAGVNPPRRPAEGAYVCTVPKPAAP